MSNHYEADWTIADGVIIRLNIGKTVGPYKQFSTLSGKYFPNRDAWALFLRHNHQSLRLFDENGREYSADEIIEMIGAEEGASKSQIEWLTTHHYIIHPTPPENFDRYDHKNDYWLDGEQLMCSADFS